MRIIAGVVIRSEDYPYVLEKFTSLDHLGSYQIKYNPKEQLQLLNSAQKLWSVAPTLTFFEDKGHSKERGFKLYVGDIDLRQSNVMIIKIFHDEWRDSFVHDEIMAIIELWQLIDTPYFLFSCDETEFSNYLSEADAQVPPWRYFWYLFTGHQLGKLIGPNDPVARVAEATVVAGSVVHHRDVPLKRLFPDLDARDIESACALLMAEQEQHENSTRNALGLHRAWLRWSMALEHVYSSPRSKADYFHEHYEQRET